jgi:DNA-binding NarL/FixJ family response regulator
MASSGTPLLSVRILVVDDYEPWRAQICSMLQTRPEVRIVAESADGLEAVQRARELKPDLILLDIGLPRLNGIEAAKRIRQNVPSAQIIFLTQNSDKDVVAAALRTGAHGYVLKADVGSELFTAMAGVLDTDDFVSSGIKRAMLAEVGDNLPPPLLK